MKYGQERALYAEQDQLMKSDQAVAANLIAVYKALGGGWELVPLAQGNSPFRQRPRP